MYLLFQKKSFQMFLNNFSLPFFTTWLRIEPNVIKSLTFRDLLQEKKELKRRCMRDVLRALTWFLSSHNFLRHISFNSLSVLTWFPRYISLLRLLRFSKIITSGSLEEQNLMKDKIAGYGNFEFFLKKKSRLKFITELLFACFCFVMQIVYRWSLFTEIFVSIIQIRSLQVNSVRVSNERNSNK